MPAPPIRSIFSHSLLLPHVAGNRVADSVTSTNPPQPESSVAGLSGSRSISRTKSPSGNSIGILRTLATEVWCGKALAGLLGGAAGTPLVGVTNVAGPLCPCAHAQQPADSASKSWTDSVTAPFKQGFDKLGRALNPKPSASARGPEDEAVSLKGKGKPGPELYLAVARVYQQAGKPAEAEQQYRAALKEFPNDLPVLLSYAQLKDNLGRLDEAIEIYQRAAKAYPQQASIYNNLGLCYARQNRLDEAVAAMSRAIQLDGKNTLYRNNIATVLVDQGKLREAFANLRAVHGAGAAYYNMGYLLHKKGQTQAALQHFTLALRADPSLAAARCWVEYLQRSMTQARLPQHPAAMGLRITSPPPMAEQDIAVVARRAGAAAFAPNRVARAGVGWSDVAGHFVRAFRRPCRAAAPGAHRHRGSAAAAGELRTKMNAEVLRFPFSLHRSASVISSFIVSLSRRPFSSLPVPARPADLSGGQRASASSCPTTPSEPSGGARRGSRCKPGRRRWSCQGNAPVSRRSPWPPGRCARRDT